MIGLGACVSFAAASCIPADVNDSEPSPRAADSVAAVTSPVAVSEAAPRSDSANSLDGAEAPRGQGAAPTPPAISGKDAAKSPATSPAAAKAPDGGSVAEEETSDAAVAVEDEAMYEAAFKRLSDIAGAERMAALRAVFGIAFPDDATAYSIFRSTVKSINMQSEAYNFTDEQISAMIDGFISSTPSTLGDKTEHPETTASQAPSHDADGATDSPTTRAALGSED
jgi:hypothetical protein